MAGQSWSEARKRTDAARRAFRYLPKDLKNTIRKSQRAELGPIWKSAMAEKVSAAPYTVQQSVFKSGTRVQAGLPLYLIAGAGSKRMAGGGTPSTLATTVEFGSSRRGNYTRYSRRSRTGGSHTVTRRTAAGLPPSKANGYVAYPALANALPKIIGSWVVAINERIYQAVDEAVSS